MYKLISTMFETHPFATLIVILLAITLGAGIIKKGIENIRKHL